jgi:hypothetical protein
MAKSKKAKIESSMNDDPLVDFDGARFKALMSEIERYAFSEMKDYHAALEKLRDGVHHAILFYYAERYAAVDATLRNLHELRTPLARTIEILRHEPNQPDIFFALEGDPDKPAYLDLHRAVEQYEALLNNLEKISVAVPPPPKRNRQRPARKDLRVFVELLANEWRVATRKPFTRNWHNGEPTTAAMQFVHAVVKFADPRSLPSLSKMTEKVVKERRHMRSGKLLPWQE